MVQNPQRMKDSRADLYLHLPHFNAERRAAVWGQESDWK